MMRIAFGGLLFLGDTVASVYLTPFDVSKGCIYLAIGAAFLGVWPELNRWADRFVGGRTDEA